MLVVWACRETTERERPRIVAERKRLKYMRLDWRSKNPRLIQLELRGHVKWTTLPADDPGRETLGNGKSRGESGGEIANGRMRGFSREETVEGDTNGHE